MKKRNASAIMTLILGHLLVFFIVLTHVVGGLVTISGQPAGFGGFWAESLAILQRTFVPDFAVVDQLIGFIIAVGALVIALVFAIVWIIRLLIHRRKWGNVFSPILFFFSICVAVYLISGSPIVEAAFLPGPSQIVSIYWFVTGIIIVVLGLHLLVVGLASSGRVKVESILSDIDDEYVVVEEVVEPEDEEEVVEEVVEEVAPVVEEEDDFEEEDLVVIKEEVIPAEKVANSAPAEVDLSDAKLQALIRRLANEEIDKRPVPKKEVIVREVVVEKEKVVEPVREPVREPEKVVAPRPVREERVIEVVEEKPVVKKAPVIAPVPVAPKTDKVERIPFPRRMQIVEDQVKVDYNELKSYLLSYGLNSRVSNVADSFRQGRVLFAKLTNSGNSGLKLFLPIKPEDYPDSKIPLKSAEGLKQYEDVPTFIYIRSDLSMKRAKQLIDDIMIKNGVARKNDAIEVDHVKELA